MSKHDFYHFTLTFDLQPWRTIPAWRRSRTTHIPKTKVKGQTVQTGELGQTNKHTHERTDGRYQVHYLPCFAIDNDVNEIEEEIKNYLKIMSIVNRDADTGESNESLCNEGGELNRKI